MIRPWQTRILNYLIACIVQHPVKQPLSITFPRTFLNIIVSRQQKRNQNIFDTYLAFLEILCITTRTFVVKCNSKIIAPDIEVPVREAPTGER